MTNFVVMEKGWEYNDETYDEGKGEPRKVFQNKKDADENALELTIQTLMYMDNSELKLYNNREQVIELNKYREIMGTDVTKIDQLNMLKVLNDEKVDDDEIEIPQEREKLIEFIKNMKISFFDVVKVD